MSTVFQDVERINQENTELQQPGLTCGDVCVIIFCSRVILAAHGLIKVPAMDHFA